MINGRLITLLKDAKKYVYYEIFSQWVILILQILMTFLVSYLIDSYINNSLTKAKIILSINFTFFSLIVYYYLNKLYVRSVTKASLDAKKILRKKIYSKLIKLGISYNKDFATSNLVQLTVEGVEQLETFFGQYYPQLN